MMGFEVICCQESFAAQKSGGGGGGVGRGRSPPTSPPTHLQTKFSRDRFQLIICVEASLRGSRREGVAAARLLQTDCSHAEFQKDCLEASLHGSKRGRSTPPVANSMIASWVSKRLICSEA